MDLKARRLELGLKQQDVAQRAGIPTTSLYARYERGVRPPTRAHAKGMGKVLKMPELQTRIASAQSAYNRAVDQDDDLAAIKAVSRLVKLAQEAEKAGGYTIDWDALETLVESLDIEVEDDEDDEPVSRKRRDEDELEDDGLYERDAFGRRVNKDVEPDDGPVSRDGFGRRVEADDYEDFEDFEDDGRDAHGRKLNKDL